MSWAEAFVNRYEEWSAPMTADVPFYIKLAREADGPLVELAIGNGRVAIPVAQATGQRVIGIDSSPAMLEQARLRAAEAGVELDLREGDMRDLVLDQPAGLIYCPSVRSCICQPAALYLDGILRQLPGMRSTAGTGRCPSGRSRP
jgi:SAM-dependent methyltransferase